MGGGGANASERRHQRQRYDHEGRIPPAHEPKAHQRRQRGRDFAGVQTVDPESTGRITLANLRLVSQKLGEVVPDSELKEMIDAFEDGTASGKKKGYITYNEFVKIMRSDIN